MSTVYTVDELKNCLYPTFQQYGVKTAVLFGSYGKGTATSKSDVDILVDSGLKGLSFVGLIEAVKTALGGMEVDMFDVAHIEKDSPLDTEISKTGVKIYEK
jgi:hypothetical protein